MALTPYYSLIIPYLNFRDLLAISQVERSAYKYMRERGWMEMCRFIAGSLQFNHDYPEIPSYRELITYYYNHDFYVITEEGRHLGFTGVSEVRLFMVLSNLGFVDKIKGGYHRSEGIILPENYLNKLTNFNPLSRDVDLSGVWCFTLMVQYKAGTQQLYTTHDTNYTIYKKVLGRFNIHYQCDKIF